MRPILFIAFVLGCAHTQEAVERARGVEPLAVFPEEIHSLTHGVGGTEDESVLWAASATRVWELAPGAPPREAWKAPRFARILHLEAAQLDDDVTSEWVVVLDAGRVRGEIVDAQGGVRVSGKPWYGFLRPVDDGGKARLIGQKAGGDRPFWGPIQWIDRAADGTLTHQGDIGVPDTVSLFDLHPTSTSKGPRWLAWEQSGQLAERNPARPRDVTWRGDDRPVGRPVAVDRSYTNLLGEERAEALTISPAPDARDLDGDGTPEILVAGNPSPPVRIMENLLALQGGDVRLYAWKERGLTELARSPLVGRAVVGVAHWRCADRPVWVAAVWTRLSGGFVPAETRLLTFDPTTGDPITCAGGAAAAPAPSPPEPAQPASPAAESTPSPG
jgi:hypothetical protein